MTTTPDGLRLHQQTWLGDAPKAAIVLVHGLGEHSARYEHVAERFTATGYDIHTYDLRGHGRSEGERTYIEDIKEHTGDLDRFVTAVRSRTANLPLFLLGHSMGGAISARFLIDGDRGLRGAILSAPAVRRAGILGKPLEAIFMFFAQRWPHFHAPAIKGERVTRDPDMASRYDADPLVDHAGVTIGTFAAIVRGTREIDARSNEILLPVLLAHGTKDKLVKHIASERLHERVGSQDKTLKIYEGLYHEILNEPEREQVMQDMLDWLDAHTKS